MRGARPLKPYKCAMRRGPMIALLAAIPEETPLVREALQQSTQKTINGITVTTGKLAGTDVCLAHSGIGKAAAAAAAVALLCGQDVAALWLFGCGGAYPDSTLVIGDLALAKAEIFGDEGVCSERGFRDFSEMNLPMRQADKKFFNTWPVDQELFSWAQPRLEEHAKAAGKAFCSGPFVTVSCCTGTTREAKSIAARTSGICENMEGAAVALACQQMKIPMLEIRGISNLVEDRDMSRWDLAAGMAAAQEAVLHLLQSRHG